MCIALLLSPSSPAAVGIRSDLLRWLGVGFSLSEPKPEAAKRRGGRGEAEPAREGIKRLWLGFGSLPALRCVLPVPVHLARSPLSDLIII